MNTTPLQAICLVKNQTQIAVSIHSDTPKVKENRAEKSGFGLRPFGKMRVM